MQPNELLYGNAFNACSRARVRNDGRGGTTVHGARTKARAQSTST